MSSVVCVCIAIWIYGGLFESFEEYDDWRAWLFYAIGVFVILFFISGAFKFTFTTYTQITIDAQYILMKTPLSTAKIPWDEVLGVHLMRNGEAFRVIGPRRNILFNAKDYEDSDYLLELLMDKLSPVLNRDLPSMSEDVLLDIIEIVLRSRPGASPFKVFDKVLSVDSKLRYEKVKELMETLRNNT